MYSGSISMKGPYDSYKQDVEIGDLDSDPKDIAFDEVNKIIYILVEDFSTIMKFDIDKNPIKWEGKDSNGIFVGKLPEGIEMILPGDNATMEVELLSPIAMDKGLKFAIREGGRTVGAGVVSEIKE